ncbi:MAG: glycosyltransferase [Alphaproteobacteria bacterium]|nr:glycosyltransferase [Alphaproteobacteria bacterium]
MAASPRITIVTPSLNQGRFIEQCLASVAEQGFADLEHIVVDGGSTDGTLEILERWRDRLSQVIVEPDDGAADAINKGLARATGEIVTWLNADDFLLPGALARVVEAWRADPSASFWFGNGVRAAEDGTVKERYFANPLVFDRRALIEGINYVLQPATFMSRAALETAGPLDVSLRWGFDWDLWIRLSAVAAPRVIEADLAATREWGSTLTASGGFRRAEELRRVAERHGGHALSRGALCYWLDTLVREAQRPEAGLGDNLVWPAVRLWTEAQDGLAELGVDPAGMPAPAERRGGAAVGAGALTIGIDLHPLVAGVSGGIVPWVGGVLRDYVRAFPQDRVIVFHRGEKPPILLNSAQVLNVSLADYGPHFHAAMAPHLKVAGVDVLIRAYPQEPALEVPANPRIPDFPIERQVFVIPDLQHEFFPQFFPGWMLASRRRAFHLAMARAGGIATLTGHSRRTILDSPWTACPDVFLMPAALPEELAEERLDGDEVSRDEALGPASVYRRYFFMPANLWPHKNHRRLFEALRKALPHLPPDTGLVLTGNPDGWSAAVDGFGDLPIYHLGYVDHGRMRALFRHAEALVYFSLFEGFGMPLLEAFHYGTPVICANSSSLPEVGGDAVLSCDPTDTDAIAGLMRRIVDEPGLHAAMVERGRKRLDAYRWRDSAQALRLGLLRVLDRALSDPAPVVRDETKPRVGIVMPTRNQGRFIRRSIDSVLAQDYDGPIELLVMDGASTDDTVEILKSYGDLITWISEPDKGQTDAIVKGFARVGGEILAYLNSDDILLPDAISRVARHMALNPECDMLYGNADYIDEDDRVTGLYNSAPYSFARLMEDCCVCQPAAFWRRRIADLTGPFDAKLKTAMDYDYWLRIANAGGCIHFIEDKLAQSRLYAETKTLSMREVIFAEVFDICRRHGGYVSVGYVYGLWAHRLNERGWWGPWISRLAPTLYKAPALVHYARIAGTGEGGMSLLSRHVYYFIRNRAPRVAGVLRWGFGVARALKPR